MSAHDEGGGASRSTDPAAGSSAATDVSLREYLGVRIEALDRHVSAEIAALRRETLTAQSTAKEAVEVASIESKERLDQHNNVLAKMETLTRTFATKDVVERIESWQSRLTGGMVVLAVIGVVNLAKLFLS